MGILQQASCTIPNSPKMSMSFWARCNTNVSNASLIDFGSNGDEVRGGENGWFITTSGGQVSILSIFFGLGNSIDMIDYVSGDPDNASLPDFSGYGSVWYPQAIYGGGEGLLNTKVAVGKWFHFFSCCDFSIPTVHAATTSDIYTSAPKLKVFVNCVELPNTAVPDNLPGSGLIAARAFRGGPGPATPVGAAAYYPPEPLHVPPIGAASVYIPGFDLGINSFKFAIPLRDEYADGDIHAMSYADVQVWVGQYIDLSTNIDKFVNLVGGSGRPVPVSVATAAFGPQDILFTGGKSSFIVNGGTAGPFDKIGTINDFSPGPSF